MSATDLRVRRLGEQAELDLTVAGARAVFDCESVDHVVFSIAKPGTDWPTNAVVTIKISNDGVSFSAFSTTVTKTAIGMTEMLAVTGVRFVAAEVTTAGTGTSPISFQVICYGRSAA